jgi:nitrate reductase gamma subunit
MSALYSLIAVLLLLGCGLLAGRVEGLYLAAGIAVPYTAAAIFLAGICYRVVRWARTPVPFRIPTTCGQQKSLPWIDYAKLENPASTVAAIGRMALEILCFRSLFRNTRTEVSRNRAVIGENKFLWLGAIAFHYALLLVLLRHLRLFLEPVPAWVLSLQKADGFFQVGAPEWYLSDVVLLAGLAYLLARRLRDPLLRYISLFTDYFALFLISGIALTGILMRYFTKTDVAGVKQFALGLATFSPSAPKGVGPLFFAHLLLVCVLAAYFPFSKLMHMGGIFLSPTRNLANTSRTRRHINEWNYPVKTHSYAEWEEEFKDKMVAAGIPLETEHARTAIANRT